MAASVEYLTEFWGAPAPKRRDTPQDDSPVAKKRRAATATIEDANVAFKHSIMGPEDGEGAHNADVAVEEERVDLGIAQHRLWLAARRDKEIKRNLVTSVIDTGCASPEQRRAHDFIVDPANVAIPVMITGGAGTGKSFLIRWVQATLRKYTVVGPTNLAIEPYGKNAYTISTLCSIPVTYMKSSIDNPKFIEAHRYKCIEEGHECLLLRILSRIHPGERHALIVEEVGMFSRGMLNLFLEVVLHGTRKYHLEKLQIVMCGDMLQLPPIDGVMAWNSRLFQHPKLHVVVLKLNQRVDAANDDVAVFVDLLRAIRTNACTREHYAILKSREAAAMLPDVAATATKLVSLRASAADENTRALIALGTPIHQYDALTTKKSSGFRLAPTEWYAVGQKVLFYTNHFKSVGIVNGTLGTVVGFQRSRGASTSLVLPVVKLANSPVCVIVPPVTETRDTRQAIDITDPDAPHRRRLSDKTTAQRTMIPLCGGFAMTIHKAQGMTIRDHAVVVDLDGLVSRGGGYVALSRNTSLDTLYIENLPNHNALGRIPSLSASPFNLQQNALLEAKCV